MTSNEHGNEVVDTALRGLRDVLTADGYDLEWSTVDDTRPDDTRLVIRVVAGEEACEDCLVPMPVLEAIMADALDGTPYTVDHVELPAA